MPTGFSVSNSPVTSSGDLTVAFAAGYSLPTTISQGNWNDAYAFVTAFPTGSAGDLIRFDAFGALESFTPDYMPNPFSALGEMIYSNSAGAPLIVSPNITTTKKFLSMTGTGLDGGTPNWTTISSSDVGAVPTSRTLTINGTAYDLTADRSWSVGTVTSIGLSSTTSGITIASTPVTSSGTITIEISTASGSSNGLLSSTDWTTFNSKLNNPFLALGDLIYSNAGGIGVRRSGNTSTTKMFLSQTGDGTNSAAPQWEAITTTTIGAVPTSRTLTINGTAYDLSADRSWSVGTVTSVALSVPTGLTITGSPITGSGTLAIGLQSGYSIPTTASQTNWDAAYNDKINSASVSGTTTKTLTLNQQDGGTITASWTDINTDAVTSVFGRTGAVVATNGDYNTSQVTENVANLYFTNARARSAISLTTTGSSGSSTYDSGTGVLNVPTYTAAGLGAVPTTRTLTINDVPFDLSADRSWSVGDFGTW
jgi:predicted heme/steroid binding protein